MTLGFSNTMPWGIWWSVQAVYWPINFRRDLLSTEYGWNCCGTVLNPMRSDE